MGEMTCLVLVVVTGAAKTICLSVYLRIRIQKWYDSSGPE